MSDPETLAHVTGDDAPAVPDAPTIPTVAADIGMASAAAATMIFRIVSPLIGMHHLRCRTKPDCTERVCADGGPRPASPDDILTKGQM